MGVTWMGFTCTVLVPVVFVAVGGKANEVLGFVVLVVVVVVVFSTVVSTVTELLGYTTSAAGVTVVPELGPDPRRPPMTPRPNRRPRMSPASPNRARRAQQRGPQQVFLTA